MNELLEMYQELGISPAVYHRGEEVLAGLRRRFEVIDQVAEYNQGKVLHAMQRNRVSAACGLPPLPIRGPWRLWWNGKHGTSRFAVPLSP